MISGPVLLCGSCGHGPLRPVLDLGDQPLPQARPGIEDDRRYPLRLVRCTRCTLVHLDYIVPQRDLFPDGYPYATGNTKALRDHFARLAVEIVKIGPAPGDLIIDIGGNDGTMLKALREIAPDNRLLLVEPTAQARKAGQAGIDIVGAYFTAGTARKIRQGYGPAKVITASSVFGHVPDPHDFLDGVTELLADDGMLIIENQDWHNIIQDLQIDTIYHEHLRYYTPASLSFLLEQHGLIITSLTRTAMHGGAFRAVCARQAGDLKRRVADLVTRLIRLLDEAVCAGPVYAVGAPTRATPLVNYASIGSYLACACEVTGSEKIGALIPGTDVRIVDEQILIDDQPPHALLLAWDSADTIIPALRKRGYAGRFILPLPEPRYADD